MKKIINIIILLAFGIYLLPNICNFNNVLAAENEVKPGDKIDSPSPSSHPQHALYENDYSVIKWIYTQRDVYDKWVEQGRKTADDGTGLCYITAGGIDWALVAVSDIYGQVGDYLKVHIKDKEGKEKDCYMIICDIKGIEKDNSKNYWVGDIHYGHAAYCGTWRSHCKNAHKHTPVDKHLNILEFVWNWGTDTEKLCQLYTDVQYIINGGNYFENPDGPIGFTVGPDETNESYTFAGACGTFFRQIWDGLATFMDNTFNGKNKATSLYSLNTTKLASDAWVWPCPGYHVITSPFGYRGNIGVAGASTYHKGIDIGGAQGAIEVAARSGTITFADWGGRNRILCNA